jgi:hypothetical protein
MKEPQHLQAGAGMVFIVGITMRSGTNYLNNLLLRHPQCEYPGIVWEDYFLAHADLLRSYADSVYKHWKPAWKEKLADSMGKDPVMRTLGEGLTFLFKEQYRRRAREDSADRTDSLIFVTATPSVRNLDCFFDLFPGANLLIIIRDGRSVVESGVKSFDWDYEHAMINWAQAARKILQFDHKMRDQEKRYLVVRYEDLFLHTREKMTEVLKFLNLDIDRYDFAAAENLPVMGSCELRDSEGAVHWQARKKDEHFDPLERWRHWGSSLHLRFDWIAGDYSEELGYSRKEGTDPKFIWRIWNRVLDFLLQLDLKLQQRNSLALPFIRRLRCVFFSAVRIKLSAKENIAKDVR